MKVESVVYRVTRFVPHYSEALPFPSAFDFEHLLAFKFRQPRVGQVERNCEAWDVIRREPFFGQPDVRLEAQATRFELFEQRARTTR
jgi:hypothetical protein